MSRRPVFLERRSYRRRRAMEAARLLPVVGAFLFLMPLVWAKAPGRDLDTAHNGIYLFVVWAGLIVGAFLFTRVLRGGEEDGADRARRDETGGPPA